MRALAILTEALSDDEVATSTSLAGRPRL